MSRMCPSLIKPSQPAQGDLKTSSDILAIMPGCQGEVLGLGIANLKRSNLLVNEPIVQVAGIAA